MVVYVLYKGLLHPERCPHPEGSEKKALCHKLSWVCSTPCKSISGVWWQYKCHMKAAPLAPTDLYEAGIGSHSHQLHCSLLRVPFTVDSHRPFLKAPARVSVTHSSHASCLMSLLALINLLLGGFWVWCCPNPSTPSTRRQKETLSSGMWSLSQSSTFRNKDFSKTELSSQATKPTRQVCYLDKACALLCL